MAARADSVVDIKPSPVGEEIEMVAKKDTSQWLNLSNLLFVILIAAASALVGALSSYYTAKGDFDKRLAVMEILFSEREKALAEKDKTSDKAMDVIKIQAESNRDAIKILSDRDEQPTSGPRRKNQSLNKKDGPILADKPMAFSRFGFRPPSERERN